MTGPAVAVPWPTKNDARFSSAQARARRFDSSACVRFLALAAALTLPADQRVAEQRAVGDDAEQLVAAQRPEADRRKGQLLRVAEIELAQRLAGRKSRPSCAVCC